MNMLDSDSRPGCTILATGDLSGWNKAIPVLYFQIIGDKRYRGDDMMGQPRHEFKEIKHGGFALLHDFSCLPAKCRDSEYVKFDLIQQ
jgi:hypothetical protein